MDEEMGEKPVGEGVISRVTAAEHLLGHSLDYNTHQALPITSEYGMGRCSIVFRLCFSRNHDRRNCVLLDQEYSQSLDKGSRPIGIGIDCYRPDARRPWGNLPGGIGVHFRESSVLVVGAFADALCVGPCHPDHICVHETTRS